MKDINLILKDQPVLNPEKKITINAGDILEYIYTSGTTGFPKATILIHQKWMQLGYGAGGFCLNSTSQDVQYFCLPLYHNSGINIAWASTLIHGGTFSIKKIFSFFFLGRHKKI